MIGLRGVRAPLALVLLCAGVLAGLVWKAALSPGVRLFPLEFQTAQWIETADATPDAYFRKELALEGSIKDAYLALAMPDCAYELIVNGVSVSAQPLADRSSAGVFDIGAALHPGKNVIAVHVSSGRIESPAHLAAEGGWRDVVGRVHGFATDTSWTAAAHEEVQANGTVAWTSPLFLGGTPARSRGRATRADLPWIPQHPAIYQTASPAHFLAAAKPASSMVFSSVLELPADTRGAWVRLIALESYDIVVNDHALAQRQNDGKTLDLLDVTPYAVRGGPNRIDVRVGAPNGAPRFALDVIVATEKGPARRLLDDPAGWSCRPEQSFKTRPTSQGLPVVPWGDVAAGLGLTRAFIALPPPTFYLARQSLAALGLSLLAAGLAVLDWLLAAWLLRRAAPQTPWPAALRQDSLLRLPILLGLATLYLLSFDVRFDPAYPFSLFFVAVAIASLYLLRAGTLLSLLRPASAPRAPSAVGGRRAGVAGAVLLALIGTGLRLQVATSKSLDHDEISMALAAEQVRSQGWPVRLIGPLTKPLTTYELVPYPIALSTALFGSSELAVRLPSLLFACATTLLLYVAAARTWGVAFGLLAAALHAFSPFAIYWGSSGFHPSQAQFFALLCAWSFAVAVDVAPAAPLRSRWLALAGAAFCASYLSWEGTGLLLPALFLALLVRRGGDFGWLRSKALWGTVGVVAVVVGIQQASRVLANVPYAVVGMTLSQRSFALAFLDPLYDPRFYLNAFLLPEHHLLLTLVLLGCLPLLLREPTGRFYLTVMVALVVLLQNLVVNTSSRYAYFIQPLLILSACAALHELALRLRQHLTESDPWMVRAATRGVALGLPLLVLLGSSTLVLELHRLGSLPGRITDSNPDFQGFDYRAAARLVQENKRPGDVVIALMPHAFKFYSDLKSDYYLQSYTNRQVFYDPSEDVPGYMDRFVGTPVLRNLTELQDVLSRNRRAWILATPNSAFELGNDEPTLDYVRRNSRVVFESYSVRIYLWQH